MSSISTWFYRPFMGLTEGSAALGLHFGHTRAAFYDNLAAPLGVILARTTKQLCVDHGVN